MDALDLPTLHLKPSHAALLHVLEELRIEPTAFDGSSCSDIAGAARWLTTVIASPLTWLAEAEREWIWNTAAERLAERSGRGGASSMTRTFVIDQYNIVLHEPTLQEDRLGWKTWGASLMLAKRLQQWLPQNKDNRALELGAGTGLVGIYAAMLGWHVTLTDLPEIIPNLQENINSNLKQIRAANGSASAQVLDWTSPGGAWDHQSYPVVIGSDLLYSRDHPALVVNMCSKLLDKNSPDARFILEMPLRPTHQKETNLLETECLAAGLVLVEQGEETGHDDWGDRPVTFRWSIWRWM